jgi:hypothetical protein
MKSIIIIIIFCGIFVAGIIIFNYLLQHYTTKTRQFITNLITELTPLKLKNLYFQEYKFDILNNLYYMKKYFGWILIIIVLSVIGLSTYVVYDSRDYFRDLFEAKRIKLNLAKESQVDSILVEIKLRDKQIDSLLHQVETNKEVIQVLETSNKDLVKNQKTLNYLIESLKKKEVD